MASSSSSSRRLFGQGFKFMMAPAKSSSATTSATGAAPATKTGISKPFPVSTALGNFLGASESSRAGAVKKVWEYIKLNNLQNPSNKKEILCDDKLKTIFDNKEQVGFLEITKLLNQHFLKATK